MKSKEYLSKLISLIELFKIARAERATISEKILRKVLVGEVVVEDEEGEGGGGGGA